MVEQATLERGIISRILYDGSCFAQIEPDFQVDLFREPEYRTIAQGILELREQNKAIDPLSINTVLGSKPGQILQLFDLSKESSGTWDIVYPFSELVKCYQSKEAYYTLEKAASDLSDGEGVEEVADSVHKKLTELNQLSRKQKAHHFKDIISDVMGKIHDLSELPEGIPGLHTGFPGLDELTLGPKPGELWLIAARPSMGKTTFVLNLAINMALEGKKILFVSLEMHRDSLMKKVISTMAGVPLNLVNRAKLDSKQWERIAQASGAISELPICLVDDTNVGSLDVQRLAHQAKNTLGGLDAIVIDHIGLMQMPFNKDNNRNQQVGEVSRALKAFAMAENIPVICLSQLNRDVDKRPNKRPLLSDLRDSGSLEQDADIVLFLYRDDYYNKHSNSKGETELNVAKQRNGELGTVLLSFHGSMSRFEEKKTYN